MKFLNKITISALLSLIILLSSCHNEENSIKMIHSDYGDFSFVSYKKPKYSSHITTNRTQHQYSFSHKGFDYNVSFFSLDTVITSDEIMLNNLVGGIIGKPFVKLGTIKSIEYFGHPGKEIAGITSDGKSWRFKIFLIDHLKVYQLAVFNDGLNALDTPEVETFLRSFEKEIIKQEKVIPQKNQYIFNKKMSMNHLLNLMYSNIGFSEKMLIHNKWERAFDFDKLKIIEGNEYRVYNFMYPNRDSLIMLSICPYKYILYLPNETSFVEMRNQIILNNEFLNESKSFGIRKLLFKSNQDRIIVNLKLGMNSIEIWKGLKDIENFNSLNKNDLLTEFGLGMN